MNEKDIKISNLTPHAINIKCGDEMVSINSQGVVRVNEVTEVVNEIKGIKIIRKKLSGLSEDAIKLIKDSLNNSDLVIVSMLTAKAIKESGAFTDEELKKIVIVGKTLRDQQGRIIGADSLAMIDTL